ncbi:uncharacterized protein PRCAT00006031001 [Priceomyces carsonii]|uniref:uncharacterized protein n=1 Tax=Priceomyces carsonii TaxID=28549 RepID=UPI002EDAF8BC|nr:unnamed protein product [Priceomyces carsonii]
MSSEHSSGSKLFFKNFTSLVVKDQSLPGSGNSEIIFISINNTGTRLVNSRTDKSIRIWKCTPDRLTEPIIIENAHIKSVESISWHPRTEYTFASVGRDEYVRIWKGINGTMEKEIKVSKESNTPAVCQIVKFSIDGEILCVVDRDSTVSMFSVLNDYAKVQETKIKEHIYDALWFNKDHDFLMFALHDGSVPLYKADEKMRYQLKKTFTGHRSSATCLAIDPRGKYFAIGSNEGVVSIWNTATMLNSKVLSDVDAAISHVDISRDGAYIAVSYDSHSNARIYDVTTADQVFEVPNSLSGNSVLSFITWFPNKTAFIYSSDYGRTMTLMKKLDKS